MKPLLLVTGLLLLFKPLLQAEEPDDQFVRIYDLIQQADRLNGNRRQEQAREKYLEAQTELLALRKAHPDWNESVVGFRLKYVAEKLKPKEEQLPARSDSGPELRSAVGEPAGLIPLLQEKVRQLTA